ncbi:MAG: preprotein translocase subunit SecE [Patescibacteria group bacterium]
MSKTVEYIKEVRVEMKNVKWPTQRQTIFFTIAVLVVSIAVAYFLGLFDKIFAKGLEWLLLIK